MNIFQYDAIQSNRHTNCNRPLAAVTHTFPPFAGLPLPLLQNDHRDDSTLATVRISFITAQTATQLTTLSENQYRLI